MNVEGVKLLVVLLSFLYVNLCVCFGFGKDLLFVGIYFVGVISWCECNEFIVDVIKLL